MTMFPAGLGEKHLNTFLTSALFFAKDLAACEGHNGKINVEEKCYNVKRAVWVI